MRTLNLRSAASAVLTSFFSMNVAKNNNNNNKKDPTAGGLKTRVVGTSPAGGRTDGPGSGHHDKYMEPWSAGGRGGCESPWNGHREMAGWARAEHYHQQGPGHRANAGRSATRESGQQRVRACSVDRVEERGRLGWSASGQARSSKMPPPSVKSRGALGEVVRSGDQGE